jgi:toxin ParE1/3/4
LRQTWHPQSKRDLNTIVSYIAERDPRAALAQLRIIRAAPRRLLDHPLSGRLGRAEGTRELVVPGLPWLLIYEIDARKVTILRVLHGAQNWPLKGS